MVSQSPSLIFLPGLPLWSSALIAGSAIFLWWAVHAAARRPGSLFKGRRAFIIGCLLGFLALLATLHGLQWQLVYTTGWPLWIPAALGALAVEGCRRLYAVEQRIVRRPAIRRIMTGCRTGMVLLVTLMLAQPAIVTERNRSIDRYVAVIIDDTPSMAIADTGMTVVERLRMAEALGRPHSARPYRLDDAIKDLRQTRDQLTVQAEWLDSLRNIPDDERNEQLEGERGRLHTVFNTNVETLRKTLNAINAARELAATIDGPHAELSGIEAQLDQSIVGPLADLAEKTRTESMPARWLRYFRERADRRTAAAEPQTDADTDPHTAEDSVDTNVTERVEIAMETIYEPANRILAEVITVLDDMTDTLHVAGEALDHAFYHNLDQDARESIDRVANLPRETLARDLLLGTEDAETEEARAGFLRRLTETHPVKIYRMADGIEELDLEQWRQSVAAIRPAAADADPSARPDLPPHQEASNGETAETDDDGDDDISARVFIDLIAKETVLMARGRQTDLRTALSHVARDIPSDQLDAVILVSDARHNADGSPEEPAARFGIRGVPIHPIVFGASNAPVDAAIVSVDAPDTILSGDRARFSVEVRLDGLTNPPIAIRLLNGSEVVDTQTVDADADDDRRRVELIDRPEAIGMHRYRIELDFDAREAVATNNLYEVSVNVSQEPAHLLLIEGRPTWEFRYLKNLFSGRDPWTRIQYVLLDPRIIPDAPEREVTPAGVARASGEEAEIEATALPASLEEWLKFDVVILGDVAPDRFSAADWEALNVFVTQRGGTLIVLAGPHAMPHAYEPGTLRDLLPVHPLRTERALMLGPEREFQVMLTADGEADPMMRLAADPAENLALWAGMPPIYWRQPAVRVRDAATVLAFAAPAELPAYMHQESVDPQVAAQQRDYQRAQALIVQHQAGLGNVLYLGFNHTWRLRYRTGDTFHHRFWGQVMRWATAYKMPFGTEFIRLGTGQARYAPGESVRIRARLLQSDHTPLITDRVNALIHRDDKLVMRRDMRYLEGSPGIYEAGIPDLESGTYTVSLEAPTDEALMLEFDNILTETPPAFTVEPVIGPEWLNLTPDRGLAGHLAALTGGILTEPPDIDALRVTLGPGRIERIERNQWDLWNSWPMLGLLALMAGTEWFLRKRERLP